MQTFGESISHVKTQIDRTAQASSALTASIARMGHATAGALTLREIGNASDAVKEIDGRLRIFEKSSEKAGAAFNGIFAIAQETGTGLEDVADLYGRFARNSEALNLSQSRVLGITRTITQAMATTGGASASAQAAIMQFGQSLAAGVLRGEELNSVMEQAPALADAIARGMGRTTGELKAMGEAGLITVPEIIAALEKMRGEIEAQFALMPQTISRALTRVRNEYLLYVRDSQAVQAATGGIINVLSLVMKHFDEVAGAAAVFAAVMVGRVVAARVADARAAMEQMQADRTQAAAAAEAAQVAVRRAQAEQQAALIAQSNARARVASVQAEVAAEQERAAAAAQLANVEAQAARNRAVAEAAMVRAAVEADREIVASATAASRQEIAARWAQFAETKLIVQQEIALEKVRLEAQFNDVGRAARLRELADLSKQLAAIETSLATQSAQLAAARTAQQEALAAQDARIAKARQIERDVVAAEDAKLTAQRVANEQSVARAAETGAARVVAAREAETAATGAAAAATGQLRTAQVAATTASAAAARGVGMFGMALGALGGPIGALITALTIAGGAWLTFGDKAESAADRAEAVADRVKKIRERLAREQKFGSGDEADIREDITRLQALVARDEAWLAAEGQKDDPSILAGAVAKRKRSNEAEVAANQRALEQIEAQTAKTATTIGDLGGPAWRRFFDNPSFNTELDKDLAKITELSKAYAEAYAEIQRKAGPGVDVLSTDEGTALITRFQAKLGELQAEMAKTATVAQEKLRDALVDAIQAGAEKARELKAEIAELLAEAAKVRSGVSGAGAKAQDRRDKQLTDEQRDNANYRRAQDALDSGRSAAVFAQNAALDGRTAQAQKLAKQAVEQLKLAANYADKISDDASATAMLDRIADAEASALEAQAAIKTKQLKSIQGEMQAQQQQLAGIEARLVEIKGEAAKIPVSFLTVEADKALDKLTAKLNELQKRANAVTAAAGGATPQAGTDQTKSTQSEQKDTPPATVVKADTTQAQTDLQKVEKAVSAIPAEKKVVIKTEVNGTPTFGDAASLPTGLASYTATTIEVTAEADAAKTELSAVKTDVDAIPAEKTVVINTVVSGTATFGDAAGLSGASVPGFSGGGWTGWGNPADAAGVVHQREWVVTADRTGEPGALSFLALFNQVGMRALDLFANGYAQGGYVTAPGATLLQSVADWSLPAGLGASAVPQSAASAASSSDGMVRSGLTIPGIGTFEAQMSESVYEQLAAGLRRASLQRGRRRS